MNVKAFQETLHAGMCGPASLKIVLEYWGIEKSEEELASLCGVSPDIGISDKDIEKVARSFGLNVEIKENSGFDDIHYWLERKVPVIVDWFTRGRADYSESEVADGHYSVVSGLDQDFIYLQDPEIGKIRRIKKNDFLRVWFDFKGEVILSHEDMILRQLIAIYPDSQKF